MKVFKGLQVFSHNGSECPVVLMVLKCVQMYSEKALTFFPIALGAYTLLPGVVLVNDALDKVILHPTPYPHSLHSGTIEQGNGL